MAFIEERIHSVESDLREIREDIGVIKAGQTNLQQSLALVRDDVAELKAGQIEIRNLLSRIVAKLDGVAQ
jgi:septation ring formation regulator EzrA